jgi:hypothetical protein
VLAISVAAGIDQLHREYTVRIREVLPWMFVANVIGIVAAALGIVCVFWHFCWLAAIIFVAFGIISTVGWGVYITVLNEANVEKVSVEAANEENREEAKTEQGDLSKP